ncbi:MAG: PQQ-dependent sugar dehydrogenase [Rhodospirillales bacterium]
MKIFSIYTDRSQQAFCRGRRLVVLVALAVPGWGGHALAAAETVPQPLRSDIQVQKLLVTENPNVAPTRIAKDPRDDTLFYLKLSGDLYQVDRVAKTSTLVATSADHGVRLAQGMAIAADGTIYLVGNGNVGSNETRGTIVKGVPQPGGRVWSVLARSASYPRSKTAFDHRMNGIVVDPTGTYVYVNSGSRTDHGEVQSTGGLYPGLREAGLTACILKLPANGTGIVLKNDRAWLKSHGYVFAEGTRNTFDMALDADGNLFGTENGPDRDMSDELNWLSSGNHYGFPWRIGGADNPQQFDDYDPGTDPLLNPLFNAVSKGYYRNDPQFPPRPAIPLVEPIPNFGPHADSFRDPSGAIKDASALHTSTGTFTAHRSPLGLVFDRAKFLAPEFRGDGFMLSWTKGDPSGDTRAGPFKDPGQDLLHLQLTKTATGYTLRATRIVGKFNQPVDAEIIGNHIYVLDYAGTQSIWDVTLPL